MVEKNIHAGHRDRVKEEFLTHGLDAFPDHKVLEFLLYYAVPQGDTNALAHALIDRFGSLSGVMDAPEEELEKLPGVGRHTAILLKLVPALGGQYLSSRSSAEEIVNTSRDVRELLVPYFFGAHNELVFLVCLDAKHKLLGVRKLGEGSVNAAEITTRKVVEEALALNAFTVILAHNHTSGLALPSPEDKATTQYLKDVLASVGVELYDHAVFADGDMVSLRDSGFFRQGLAFEQTF